MTRWSERLRDLDNRVMGPVRASHTSEDFSSGNWIYLVSRRALLVTVALMASGGAGSVGLMWLLGMEPSRSVFAAGSLGVGALVWQRYTRHHYKRNP
ncbi:MAG TPA: hypothetical protein VM347_05745 [Nonomuraea sp.]|nr:hypothetical protein [Nonomuraea sp.]